MNPMERIVLFKGDVEMKRQNGHWWVTLYITSMQYQGSGRLLVDAIEDAFEKFDAHQ